MSTQAYPLEWPPGRKRTKPHLRQAARFGRQVDSGHGWTSKTRLTIADSTKQVLNELRLLGATAVVISSNLKLKNDGLPASGQREPEDPGVAVYFQLDAKPHSLSCDTWDRAADNLAAVAKHVEAMRGQLRWGVADVAAMFAGFRSLPGAIVTPEPMTLEQAAFLLASLSGMKAEVVLSNPEAAQEAYRAACKKLHPDTGCRDEAAWHRLQQAAEIIRRMK